jgi:glutamate racemase
LEKSNKPIGFFDSGLGGLSVLKEALKIMPNENYIYLGDSINVPYGVKSVEEVKSLTFKAVEYLLDRGVKGIAIACNTATTAAVSALRIEYPDLPLVGIEPALKPAVEIHKEGKILIMATSMTLKEEKFYRLMKKYEDIAEIVPLPCPGLMEFIEAGKLEGEEVETYIMDKLGIYINDKISSIVLGCTHYPFIKSSIIKLLGEEVVIIDGGLGTVKELKRRLKEKDLLNKGTNKGSIEIINTSNRKEVIDLSYELLEIQRGC